MRKLTQKLVLSVVTMALVVIALGTSTFAWFTLQNAASIGSFQGQVTAGTGIEVSLGEVSAGAQNLDFDNQNYSWFTAIPAATMQTFIDTKYPTFRFNNVTSPDGVVMKNEDGTGAVAGSFIEFNLYFRSREANMPIGLTQAALGGPVGNWTVNSPEFTHTDGIKYGTLANGTITNSTMKVAAWTAARLSVKSAGQSVFIIQREAVVGDVANITNSTALPHVSYDFTETGTSTGIFAVGTTLLGAASYEKANAIGRPNWDENTTTVLVENIIPDAATAVNPSTVVLQLGTVKATGVLAGYAVGTLTVRVWIEGWDADAYDAIFNQMLTVALAFAKAE